jgi:hypothetical protein
MLLPKDSQLDQFAASSRVFLALGIGLMILQFCLPKGLGIGFLSGFAMFSMGIYGLCLRRWRTDPGLWMLAGLLAVLLGPSVLYFEFLNWKGTVQLLANGGIAGIRWQFVIDATVGLVLALHGVRMILGIAIANWKRTHARI